MGSTVSASGLVAAWDCDAIALNAEKADRNVYELDLGLWRLLAALARETPARAAERFSLTANIVAKFADATPERLSRLASGVLLSFRPAIPEQAIFCRLAGYHDPGMAIDRMVDGFAAYWLLLNRLAARDAPTAAVVFAVSRRVAERVAAATDNRLRHLAATTAPRFALRCAPDIVAEILDGPRRKVVCPVLKKLQQSLRGGENENGHRDSWSLDTGAAHGPVRVHQRDHRERDGTEPKAGAPYIPRPRA